MTDINIILHPNLLGFNRLLYFGLLLLLLVAL